MILKEALLPITVPSAGPANITAQNTSSSSVSVHWNDVPFEHQNGIITGYKVYIRKSGHDGEWDTVEVTTKHCSFTGLDLWTLYDVNVSAITSVGEGVQSDAVKVKTDEDGLCSFINLPSLVFWMLCISYHY